MRPVALSPHYRTPSTDRPSNAQTTACSLYQRAALTVEAGPPADVVPESDLLLEGITVDRRSGPFDLDSICKRKVLAIGSAGALGVKVDAARDLLWDASYPSCSMIGFKPDARRTTGVLAFALADGHRRGARDRDADRYPERDPGRLLLPGRLRRRRRAHPRAVRGQLPRLERTGDDHADRRPRPGDGAAPRRLVLRRAGAGPAGAGPRRRRGAGRSRGHRRRRLGADPGAGRWVAAARRS